MAHSFVKLLFLECPGCGVPMQFADREDEYPACNMFLTFEGELRCKKCLEGGDAKPIDFLYEEVLKQKGLYHHPQLGWVVISGELKPIGCSYCENSFDFRYVFRCGHRACYGCQANAKKPTCQECGESGKAPPFSDILKFYQRYLYWAVKLDERRLESSRIAVPLAIRKQLEMVEGFYVGKEPREAVVVKTVKPVNGHGASAKGLYPEIPELGFTIVRNTE